MSKIDEVKEKYSEMEEEHYVSYEVLINLLADLEKLRPYVELGETIVENYDQEWKDDYINERINQIKEQSNERT